MTDAASSFPSNATNYHRMDDGVIDKEERQAIKPAHQRELASRHRGVMQFAAVRTAVWMKDGVKSRVVAGKNKALGKQSRKRMSPFLISGVNVISSEDALFLATIESEA